MNRRDHFFRLTVWAAALVFCLWFWWTLVRLVAGAFA
jgi:hypothetical protein